MKIKEKEKSNYNSKHKTVETPNNPAGCLSMIVS